MGSFEVFYSFVGFVYVYCLVHQSVVMSCLVFLRKCAAQFFSNVHVSLYSAVEVLLSLCVCVCVCVCVCLFANFSNVHVCFVFRHVQFFSFFNSINVLQVLIMYLSLRVYLIIFVFIGCVFILWYFVVQFFLYFQF